LRSKSACPLTPLKEQALFTRYTDKEEPVPSSVVLCYIQKRLYYPWRQQIIAELDGKPMGYMEIIDPALESSHYWGDCGPDLRAMDIWIGVPELLNQGYGTQMMHMALARCFALAEVQGVLLDPLVSNYGAHRFYQRLGFVNQGQRHFGDDLCYVYYLSRKHWMQ